jgi:hypothetical protein
VASTTITQAVASSAYRVRITTAEPVASFPALSTPSAWVLARQDGGGGLVPSVNYVIVVDTYAVELVLSRALLSGVVYGTTTQGAGGASNIGLFAWTEAPAPVAGPTAADDPAAEAFGVDWDWLAPALDAGGDLPVVSGPACLQRDLAAIAVTEPGELFHRPTEGGGMRAKVNGAANTDVALGEVSRALRAQWAADPRVRAVTVAVSADDAGAVTATGAVTPVALADSLPVTVTEG